MEPKKTMYMVGYFNEYGYFYLWNYNSIAFNEEDANKILKEARLKGSWNSRNYEIYKVKPEHLERTEEDVGLKEFTLLQDKVFKELGSNYITWFNEEFIDDDIEVSGFWKYNPTKRVATYEYEYRMRYYSKLQGEERQLHLRQIEDKIEEDLRNQCLYRLAPLVKKVMKENNMTHIRVEFRDKYANSKLIKGFIENKEA